MASLGDLKSELGSVSKSISEIQNKVQALLEKQERYQERKNELELEIKNRECLYENNKSRQIGKEISWKSTDFEWSEQLKTVLWEKFGIRNLREMQLETINATMSKRDVILIMPTGGGKSLCYQAPAMLSGLTLVVSPLISLMEDQVLSLHNLGINAKKLSASSTREEVNATHKEMVSKDSKLKLLYVTPEKISKSKRFMAQLEKCYKSGNLSRIAIDEVHCASQWGNDFRPDYKILGILKRQFPETPLLGLTATSTDKVTLDTKKMLNIPFAMVFQTPLNRPNLYYEVRTKPDSHDATINDICETLECRFKKSSGIIYCFSCKNCEEVSKSLCSRGVSAAVYHARMESHDRYKVHKMWLEDKIKVICATVAFGMGIDKPDVRFVIHYSISKSIENYYQESGRAGRDGKPALCLLYYGFSDIFRLSTMVLTENTGLSNLNKVLQYCQNLSMCRREILFSHFGDEWAENLCNNTCDACCQTTNDSTGESEDITQFCKDLIQITKAASNAGKRLTGAKLVDSAKGRGEFKTTNSKLKSTSTGDIQRIVVDMLMKQYLKEDFHFTPYATISYLVPGPHASLLSYQQQNYLRKQSPHVDTQCQLYRMFCENWKSGKLLSQKNNKITDTLQDNNKRAATDEDLPSCSKKAKLKNESLNDNILLDLTDDEKLKPKHKVQAIVIISDSEDEL